MITKNQLKKPDKQYRPEVRWWLAEGFHTDETLIALSVSAASNPDARLALEQCKKLKGCQAHTSVMLSDVDILEFRKLGVDLTCEPKFEKQKLYQ